MRLTFRRGVVALFLLSPALPPALFAQNATLTGAVKDASGKPVDGATVSASGPAGSQAETARSIKCRD